LLRLRRSIRWRRLRVGVRRFLADLFCRLRWRVLHGELLLLVELLLAKQKAQKADLAAQKTKLTKQPPTTKRTKSAKQPELDLGNAGTMNAPTNTPDVAKKPTDTYTPPQNGSAAQVPAQNAAPSKPQQQAPSKPQNQSKTSAPPQAQIQPQPQPAAPQVSEPPAQAPEQQQAPIRKK
jgi:hypothetical protein